MTTIWTSPLTVCQLCADDFGETMYDSNTQFGWANVCQSCFDACGRGLGLGRGQKYSLETRGEVRAWYKVAG